MRDIIAGNIKQLKPTNILSRPMKNGKNPFLHGLRH